LPSYPPPGTTTTTTGFPPPSSTQWNEPATQLYASWGIRFGGYLIDVVIFVVVQLVLGALFRHSNTLALHMQMTRNGVVHHNRISLLVILITLILYLIYETIMIASRGQTVGMMAVGTKAIPAGTESAGGSAVPLGTSLLRGLADQVLRVTIIFGLLDGLFPLWDPRRQTLHDKVAGTVVIRTRQ
jgi:uncharacterized RDD family membrane protein YckC